MAAEIGPVLAFRALDRGIGALADRLAVADVVAIADQLIDDAADDALVAIAVIAAVAGIAATLLAAVTLAAVGRIGLRVRLPVNLRRGWSGQAAGQHGRSHDFRDSGHCRHPPVSHPGATIN